MKCKTKDCELAASLLSYNDTPAKRDGAGQVIDYDRVERWRCGNNHLTEVPTKVTYEQLHPAVQPERDDSVKRFHRKGFTAHQPPREVVRPPKTPYMLASNHQRHLARRQWRDQQKEAARAAAADSTS